MSSVFKMRIKMLLISCTLIILIITAVCIAAFISGRSKERQDAAQMRVIAHIGDFKITENQFKFFAIMILNQEEDTVKELYTSTSISDNDEIKKRTSDFAKEYMIRVIEAENAGIKLTDAETAALNAQIQSDYDSAKNVDGKVLTKDKFYPYYFGISQNEYEEFWKNWYIMDKYNTECENKADISEESQRLAFEEHYDILYTYNISIIPFPIDSEHTKEAQTEKANSVLGALNSGRSFTELLSENSTDNDLIASNGTQKFNPANKYKYPDIYEWLRTANPGNTGVIQTDNSVYVIRLDSITDFDQLKNTDEMIKWTRTFSVNKEITQLLNSDKYKYEIDSTLYEAMDMSEILEASYNYWKNIWEKDAN